ncbi:hybrid sensor histidine kinase/response regulator [Roseateles sp. LYH14W]|uniref:histidine kinase n=1 Tax=Pelomonas parva TaxID=3299032 RepID=A0ABW7FBS3_9BURK
MRDRTEANPPRPGRRQPWRLLRTCAAWLTRRFSTPLGELRRANRLYEALLRTNHALVRSGDLHSIAGDICTAFVESGNAVLVAVIKADAGRAAVLAGAGPIDAVFGAAAQGWDYLDPAVEHLPVPKALRSGTVVICNDYLAVQAPPSMRERAIAHGVRAVAVFPLFRDGQLWGALLFQTDRPGWFGARREELLQGLADDFSLALDQQTRQQQQQRAETALRERDRQLEGIVETAMDAVITIGADQRIRVFNAAASRIFRLPAEAALGQRLDRFLPAAARAGHEAHVQSFARDGATAAHRMGRLRQLSGVRADGSEFPIEASIARHGEGQAVLMTAIVRDISDQRAAEQARQAQLAAEAASQAKSVFLANMSHEIRTPMNAVLGFTDLALRTALTPLQSGYLSKARVAGETLLGLIDDILDLSKIEAGKLELEQAEFELDALAQALQVIVGQRSEAKGLKLQVTLRGAPPGAVVGDLQRLRQVLINLAGNAVKFTAAGEVTVDMHCTPVDATSLKLQCRVVDTGIGMTAEQMQRLFQPFSQGDAAMSRRFGGTGLGLAISRQLVELMGGSIAVNSTPGQGSSFHFTVRLGRSDRSLAPMPAPPVAAEQALLRLAGRRVLLVEDNEVNQVLAGELLRSVAGVALDIAGSGAEAIAAIARERYELVLMDVQMPGMDGYETVRRLRADPANRLLPVIAMTAHASDSDRRDCLAAGMNDFVTKPVHPDLLFRVMARWLGSGTADLPGEPGAPVSFAAGLQHCFGRAELYERVIDRFLQSYGGPLGLEQALESGDHEAAALLLHGLLSSANSVGAVPLATQARTLATALREQDAQDLAPRLAQLRRQLDATLQALAAWRRGERGTCD